MFFDVLVSLPSHLTLWPSSVVVDSSLCAVTIVPSHTIEFAKYMNIHSVHLFAIYVRISVFERED